jgi:hypothetical protein
MGLRGQYVAQSFVMPQRLGAEQDKYYFYPGGTGERPQPGELLSGTFQRQAIPVYPGWPVSGIGALTDDITGFIEQYKWPLIAMAAALLFFSGKKSRMRAA